MASLMAVAALLNQSATPCAAALAEAGCAGPELGHAGCIGAGASTVDALAACGGIPLPLASLMWGAVALASSLVVQIILGQMLHGLAQPPS